VKLIVGLGNPGLHYSNNRHNVGYQCVKRLAEQFSLTFDRVKFKARIATGQIEDVRVLLARPLTYMNLSGLSVAPLLHWYRLDLPDLLIVYDDLDLPLGRLRMRANGSSGGHRGMQSIIDTLGTPNFPRLRIGIARPSRGEPKDYVLGNFSAEELPSMACAYDRAISTILAFLTQGTEAAMLLANSPSDRCDSASEVAQP